MHPCARARVRVPPAPALLDDDLCTLSVQLRSPFGSQTCPLAVQLRSQRLHLLASGGREAADRRRRVLNARPIDPFCIQSCLARCS